LNDPIIEQFVMSDSRSLAGRRFPAVGQRRGTIVFVHGIRSHSGWYLRSCRELAQAGWDVAFPDRRGSGMNPEHRGDCPSFRRLMDDVIEVASAEKKQGGPVVVAGISWGGKIAVSLPYRQPGILDGMVLITPGIVPKVGMPWPLKAQIATARFIQPTKHFPIPLNDPALFTNSEEGKAFIDADQLGLRLATARFLFNSVQLDLYVRRALKAVKCPVLLFSAGQDRIADPEKSRNVLCRIPGLTEIHYPEAGHTLEFEGNCPFVADMTQWLEKNTLR
jgi:alpha-beta hydrolase superfamily lysophospholipase